MIRTQVQLTEDQSSSVKGIASEEGTSMAEIIRRSVDSYIASRRGAEPGERRRRAIEAAGRFASGKDDVSDRHDEYLN
jgi:hypothetical protein